MLDMAATADATVLQQPQQQQQQQQQQCGPGRINQRDARHTTLWHKLDKHFQNLHSPAFGKVSDVADVELSPDGHTVSFTGSIWTRLEDGTPRKRICVADVATGNTDIITYGPNDDQQPNWSPSGRILAFLSDRKVKGAFQLHLLRPGELGEAKPVYLPPGYTAEYVAWSPEEQHVLIGAAGLGADQSSVGGSGSLGPGDEGGLPAWMPYVEPDSEKNLSRRLFVYTVADDKVWPLSNHPASNIWEAAWCGETRIVAIVSHDETEASWYNPWVELIDLQTGQGDSIATTSWQLGGISGSPLGTHVAFVEGLCSDRGLHAGTLVAINADTKKATILHTNGIDVSFASWIDEHNLFFLGLRGVHMVLGRIDVLSDKFSEIWTSPDSIGGRVPSTSKVVDGTVAVLRSSWTRYPEIGLISTSSGYKTLASFDHDGAAYLRSVCGPIEEVSWSSFDGTEIQGFLCLPRDASRKKPLPLVLHVHGGPISAFTNTWSLGYPFVPALVYHGYAVLSTNPRGSRGRGEEFARRVLGDMGGDEIKDQLSGIDSLVENGMADPKRLGVVGGSHGGFISTWLITQTDRFAASVAIAPVTDWVSQHMTSNIPQFDRIMIRGDPYTVGEEAGQYHGRSPVRFAKNCSTPLLQIAGVNDNCTPPTQALQMYNALREHGVDSVLFTYPGEGHGVRKFPAVIDYCYRMVTWFEKYMPTEV